MKQIERTALTKAYNRIERTGRELDFERDIEIFTDDEMKALAEMYKDKTLRSKFMRIHKELKR